MPDADPNRLVHCIKKHEDLPALARPPFPNDLGRYIYDHVSKAAWDEWLAESTRIINTYRWRLGEPGFNEKLLHQLKIWLGLEQGELAETAWTPSEGDGGEGGHHH